MAASQERLRFSLLMLQQLAEEADGADRGRRQQASVCAHVVVQGAHCALTCMPQK